MNGPRVDVLDGFDVVFDATGHHTGVGTAVEQLQKRGQILDVGAVSTRYRETTPGWRLPGRGL
ncbi:MDR/zinc-dependent alcohol dehydrogenase-like family protein [Halomicrobium zhouii]|uniref:hypothetical protein n=1 Tax=Halomicrobium zhouii TaxID=767519 RepID=UPI000B7F7467|nr:hypothetical protein [Halomicrobium zhouii]